MSVVYAQLSAGEYPLAVVQHVRDVRQHCDAVKYFLGRIHSATERGRASLRFAAQDRRASHARDSSAQNL
jgi:hypothetical protein